MQGASILWTYSSVTRHVEKVRVKIEREIRSTNAKLVENYLAFLSLAITQEELRINTLFSRIEEYNWLKTRYAPTDYNFETNQWASSVTLLTTNNWLDFIQTTVREKLTSCLMMRPPFLHDVFLIPLNEDINLVVEQEKNGNLNVYIGVPFWSNEIGKSFQLGQHDVSFSIETLRNNWLLFTPQQLLELNLDELKGRNFIPPSGPFAPTVNVQNQEIYKNLVDSTIKSILTVRKKLLDQSEILEKARDYGWIKGSVDKQIASGQERFTRGIDLCDSYLCKYLKGNARDQSWAQIHDWQERDDQNRLIWELGAVTGTGVWFFDPFSRFAPKGLASFPKSETAIKRQISNAVGYAVYTKDIFFDSRVSIQGDCKPEITSGQVNTCLPSTFKIIQPLKDTSAIFIVNTLMYGYMESDKKLPNYGTLSLGVNIATILEQLALICPDNVLFLPENGDPIMFDTNGRKIDLTHDEKMILQKLSDKKEGIVTDTDGKEYYYYHVIDIIRDDGHVFIIQYRDSVYKQITQLEQQAHNFLYAVTVQVLLSGILFLAVVLFAVNFFIKRMIRPIVDLVGFTDAVALGDLEKVQVSQKDKLRKDEIGALVGSFEQMVEKMKEGNQVRALLHKIVNKEVADKILSQGVVLGGEVRKVAILFSDIRHFTHISENMAPQDVLAMLNDCLNILSGVIDDHKGVIDKYVGDEIMAFFGAPVEMENPTLQAVLCAMTMMRVLREWNRHRESINYCQLKIGIGIHVGDVIAGNMGAENHLNYTVLGHNVNLASRLCDHAGEMEILITQQVLDYPGVRANIEFEAVPEAIFKGISQPIPIFKVKY